MNVSLLPAMFVFLASLLSTSLFAVCSSDLMSRWIPSALAPTEKGVRVRIEYYDPDAGQRFADLYFDRASGSWRHLVPADADAARQRQFDSDRRRVAGCRSIPYKPPSLDEAITLRPHLRVNHSVNETPDSCFQSGDYVWFGLGFYEGEGDDGVGGIGRYRPSDGAIEVRRPQWLRDKSVDHVAFDGRYLWLTAVQSYEKSSVPHGLARYDWEKDELELHGGAAPGPCSIAINDMLFDHGELWIAGDLSLSRLDLATGRWTHYRPDRIGSTLTPAACGAIRKRALETIAQCPSGSEGESEIEAMARLAPDETREFLSQRQIALWGDPDFAAAGIVARDFDELQRIVLRRAGKVPDRTLRWALASFAEKNSRDPRWRDYAVAFARKSGDYEVVARLHGDPVAGAMIRDALTTRPAHGVVDALPWILGRDAIPLLIPLLDIVETDDWKRADRADVIQALERAAHLRIEADGSREALPADSDTWEYAAEEFGAFRRSTRDDDLSEIVKRWKQWWAAEGQPTPR